jgi:membrane protein implicated in regulation of membrane protease activity
MPKPKARTRRRASAPSAGEWLALPTLVTLLAGMLVLGMFHLSFYLALLAAFVTGLAGWLWWRRATRQPATRRRTRRPDR